MTTLPTTFEISAEVERTLASVPLAWARALDTGDADVLRSLLAEDVVVDLTPATTKIGLEFPVLSGRDTVIAAMIGAVGPLDTMHLVGNATYRGQGDGYRIETYALAQHFLPGEGPDPAATRHALMGNAWTFLVSSTPDGLRVTRFEMDCLWMQGDPAVLLAAVNKPPDRKTTMASNLDMWHEMSLGDEAMVDFDHPVDRIIAGLLDLPWDRQRPTPQSRRLWIAALLVFPVVGSVAWFVWGRARVAAG